MSTGTLRFFSIIWPAEGERCLALMRQGKVRHYFVTSNEEAANLVARLDVEGSEVFHACATYIPGRRARKQVNVHHVRALWLDLDAGPGKPYADARMAAEAVLVFCRAVGLPDPLVVSSGRGCHCYWPLSDPLPGITWRNYATLFRELCARHGLAMDPARCCDHASILRPPGSHNRKYGTPLPVVAGPAPAVLAIDRLEHVLSLGLRLRGEVPEYPPQAGPYPHRGVEDPPLRGNLPRGSGEAWDPARALKTKEVVDHELLAAACPQMGEFRRLRGCIPEPRWFAGLGVLAFTENGRQVAHEWSAGHPNYSPQETDARLDRVEKLSGPTLCARFADDAVCRGCRFHNVVKTPLDACIRLRAETTKSSPRDPPSLAAALAKPHYGTIRDGSFGLFGENKDGAPKFFKISSFPIRVIGVTSGELKEDRTQYHLEVVNGHTRPFRIGARDIFGPATEAAMADRQCIIYDPGLFKTFIREQVEGIMRTGSQTRTYDQFGWKDDGFVLGSKIFIAGVPRPCLVSDALAHTAKLLTPRPEADIRAWQAAANRLLFGPGCEGSSIATIASFAAPLMELLDKVEGGCIVTLVTGQGSQSKTTQLVGAKSVWGNDMQALSVEAADTLNSTGIMYGQLRNLPVIYDEIFSLDPELAHVEVMRFTGGRDKMRATREGGIRQLEAVWHTLIISATNVSPSAIIDAFGGSEAASWRVMELPSTRKEGLTSAEADRLRNVLYANGGVMGEWWLTILTDPAATAFARKMLPLVQDTLERTYGFTSHARYWLRALSCMLVFGYFNDKFHFIDCSVQRVVEWAIARLLEVAASKQTDLHAPEQPAQLFSAFVGEHMGDILVQEHAYRANAPRQFVQQTFKRVVGRYDRDTGLYTVDRRVLKDWLFKRHKTHWPEWVQVTKALGVLKSNGTLRTLTAGTNLPGGQTPCVEIDGRHPAIDGEGLAPPVEKQSNIVAMRR